MFNIYNAFNTYGTGAVVETQECAHVVQLPEFLLTVGTRLEQLTRIGKSNVLASISATGKACFIAVDYTEEREKLAARTEVLGTAPVDKNGLGYDYSGD